jgi:hypothetical protein
VSRTPNREDDGLFITTRSAIASVRSCKLCRHVEVYRYTGGHRGAGMVGGNKARGRMIQHLKAAHPPEYAASRAPAAKVGA